MRICCIGMNHRSAPVQIRERFAVSSDDVPATLALLHARRELSEILLISTCNRFEVYAVPSPGLDLDAGHVALRRALCDRAGAGEDELNAHAYQYFGRDAARHLFRVASSLDSMVLGEVQILGQVKTAFALAQEANCVGSMMHRLVSRAFRAAKRVRTDTEIASGGLSISWVAVQLARRIFEDLSTCRVLLLGAGEMAELAAVHLAEQGVRSLTVANRTLARAESIALPKGWKAAPLDDIEALLRDADIVISSTGSPTAVVTKDHVKRALRRRGYRPLFIIDIAVPRDVDIRVQDMDGVYLYNIDDLQAVAERNRDRRAAQAQVAEEIVRDEVDKFAGWLASQAVSPVIASLRQRLVEIRDAEMHRSDKVLTQLTPEQREAVERMTAAMIGKFSGAAIGRLKRAIGTQEGDVLAWATRELFGLSDLALLSGGGEDELSGIEEPEQRAREVQEVQEVADEVDARSHAVASAGARDE